MRVLVKDQDSEVLNFKQALAYNIVTLTMIAAEGPPSRPPLHEASELLIGHRARSVAGGKVLGRDSPSAGDTAPLPAVALSLLDLSCLPPSSRKEEEWRTVDNAGRDVNTTQSTLCV